LHLHRPGSKLIIELGGADGFGAAIVDRFSQEGCKVIILDLKKVKGEGKERADPNIHFLCGDVTSRETWEEALALAQGLYGTVDVVINNAGIELPPFFSRIYFDTFS
jgi:NAD(P)-dependent dehydrogenase (short-subunit alcohol dehydrogenase family)